MGAKDGAGAWLIDARARLSERANLKSLEWRRCDILPARCGSLRNLTQSSLMGACYSQQNKRFFNGPQIAPRIGVWEIGFDNCNFKA
jgi:hypothetical protein